MPKYIIIRKITIINKHIFNIFYTFSKPTTQISKKKPIAGLERTERAERNCQQFSERNCQEFKTRCQVFFPYFSSCNKV